MQNFSRFDIGSDWIICETAKEWQHPQKACTFAFDTETLTFIDGVKVDNEEMFKLCKGMNTEEKRKRISSEVWSWQAYDELNGFFMTNSFDIWLDYQAKAGYKFGWCYNAKFDFSQIDYKILTNPKWSRHEKRTGKAYNKGQAWTFESLHNDMGSRFAYKLWIEYKHANRHKHVHPVEYRDFMLLFPGGLANVLESLDARDIDGTPIRKLEMEYQAVNTDSLTDDEVQYCCNDVKGLYYAIKLFNNTIEEQSNGERHIFGEKTNVMTAGGFAKAELLRSLYPNTAPSKRIKRYQQEHPITEAEDKYYRDNHLYRGGICLVNPRYEGKLLKESEIGAPMKRYDVNSEYPFAMASIQDLIGIPTVITFNQWLTMGKRKREQYECIYILTSVNGFLKDGFIPVWFDPFRRDYVRSINENGVHLMFERELFEYSHWYELEYTCEKVIIYKRGERVYKPFVDTNYSLKAEAKKSGNVALSNVVKLKLNSSYGKLSERVCRTVGEYQINPETGTVHFVTLGEEVDTNSIMNVAIGSLITSVARCWILSHIREICQEEKMAYTFVYIDTDSIHTFNEYDKADKFALGGFKLEAVCPVVKYLAPKCYFDVEEYDKLTECVKVKDGELCVEVHTKGINIVSVENDLEAHSNTRFGLPIEYLDYRFDYNQRFKVLCALNVKGGKVLIPTEKYLATNEETDYNLTYSTGYDITFLSER